MTSVSVVVVSVSACRKVGPRSRVRIRSGGTIAGGSSPLNNGKKEAESFSFLCTGDPYYVLYTVLLIS